MTRLLTLVTVIFAIISLASAQIVDTLNTPLGPFTQGANVIVSWTLVAGADATGKNGALTATDSTSKNTITIDPAVPLAPKSYTWNVKVPPGTYTLGLNDGSGMKQSGEVIVNAAPGASGTAPGASGAPSGAPASSAPPAGTSGAPAATASSGTGGGSSGTGSGTGSGSGSGSSGGTASGGAPTDTSSPTQPTSISSPTKSNSASLIFSGYEVVFSLLVVAIAMVQF